MTVDRWTPVYATARIRAGGYAWVSDDGKSIWLIFRYEANVELDGVAGAFWANARIIDAHLSHAAARDADGRVTALKLDWFTEDALGDYFYDRSRPFRTRREAQAEAGAR